MTGLIYFSCRQKHGEVNITSKFSSVAERPNWRWMVWVGGVKNNGKGEMDGSSREWPHHTKEYTVFFL